MNDRNIRKMRKKQLVTRRDVTRLIGQFKQKETRTHMDPCII